MSLSNPIILFGIHQVTPYNRLTGEMYGTAKVVGEAAVDVSGELQKLYGGSQNFPWAVEDGVQNANISVKLKELPDWLFALLQGKAPTTTGADAAGACSALTNKKGTSTVAATGIATATVKAAAKADLKFSRYLVKVVSSTTVDVYAMSDVDFNRGTDKEFVNDLLKITASPLTIVASTAVEIPGFGVELTGGAGTIGMTVGDTAEFEVKPPSSDSMEVVIGGTSDVRPEFGFLIVAQQRSNAQMADIDIFRAKGNGFPLPFAEKAFQELEIKLEAFYDSTRNGVFKFRRVSPT